MNRLSLVIASSTLLLATAAIAQPGASRSADDYVCELSGKCGADSTADQAKDAPETKGFSLGTRRSPSGGQAVAAPDTKGFSLGTRQPAPAAGSGAQGRFSIGTRPAPATRPVRTATRPSVRPAAAPAAARRVDLRLSFLLGSAELTGQAQEEARVFAEALKRPELSSRRFVIEGHTDASGSRSANISLSRARAAAVADFLASQGVERSRIEVRGVGPDRPLPGKRAADPANRRVEAALL